MEITYLYKGKPRIAGKPGRNTKADTGTLTSRNHDSSFEKSSSEIRTTERDTDTPVLESSRAEKPAKEKSIKRRGRPPRLAALNHSVLSASKEAASGENSADVRKPAKEKKNIPRKTKKKSPTPPSVENGSNAKPAKKRKTKPVVEKSASDVPITPGRVTRSSQLAHNISGNVEVETVTPTSAAKNSNKANKTVKRKARIVDEDEPPRKYVRSSDGNRPETEPVSVVVPTPESDQNQNQPIIQESPETEMEIDSSQSEARNRSQSTSPQFYDPVPAPPPHNSSGRGILKKGISLHTSLFEDTTPERTTLLNRSNLGNNPIVRISESMTENRPPQHDQSGAKKARFNQTSNHTRYIFGDFKGRRRMKTDLRIQTLKKAAGLLPGFASALSPRGLIVRNPGVRPENSVHRNKLNYLQVGGGLRQGEKSTINMQSDRFVRVPFFSRGPGRNSGIFQPLREINNHPSLPAGKNPDARKDVPPSAPIPTSTNAENPRRPASLEHVDFDSIKVVSKLMKHIEKDEKRRLVDIILSRDSIGDIFCEEILKRPDFRKRIQHVATKLNDTDLVDAAEGMIFGKVESIVESYVGASSCIQHRSNSQGDMSTGFLNVLFHLLDEAAKDFSSKSSVGNTISTNDEEDLFPRGDSVPELHNLVVRRLAASIVKNDPNTLSLLNSELQREKSGVEQLQSINELLKVIRENKNWNDKMVQEAKLAVNELLEIIPGRLKFNVT